MIRRALCEFYIKALIIKELDDRTIIGTLKSLSLDYPRESYVGSLRVKMPEPAGFKLSKLKSPVTHRYLVKERVLDYFEEGPDMVKAVEILEKPRAKEFVESMLLSKAPYAAIAHRLQEMFKVRRCTVKAIELYFHYFFNVDLLDSTETRAILTLKIDRLLNSDDDEEKAQGHALKKAFYSDPRRIAASMPSSPVSALISQLQLGIIPGNIDMNSLMRATEMLVNLRLYETQAAGGLDFDRKGLNLATTSSIIQKLMESKRRPEEELRKELETISLKTDQTGVPLVHELTGGQHTVDLAAAIVSKEEDGTQPARK